MAKHSSSSQIESTNREAKAGAWKNTAELIKFKTENST
jgi:hypothetical protein